MRTVIALCLLLGSPVFAQQDLFYKSAPLTGIDMYIDGGFVLVDPVSDRLTIHLTLSQPLAANLTDAIVRPTDWSVTCSRVCAPYFSSNATIPDGSSNSASALFIFSTNANGKIGAWNFRLTSQFLFPDDNAPGSFIAEYSNTFTSAGGADTLTSAKAGESSGGHLFFDQVGGRSGKWKDHDDNNGDVND